MDLNTQAAVDRALISSAGKILCILRNALAHGGVVYLDEDGQQSEKPAAMFGFVSSLREPEIACEGKANCEGKSVLKVVGWNILRVSDAAFIDFLATWSAWLTKSRVSENWATALPRLPEIVARPQSGAVQLPAQ